jgi:uracil-DNA glycosylase
MTHTQCPPQLEHSWCEVLKEEFQKPYMNALKDFLAKERANGLPVYPPAREVFNAFSLTPVGNVKVVIIGQDPYHGPGQAHGLCFSVLKGVVIPPSLQNIYKELYDDLGVVPPNHGCLTSWAEQGVLLLNATLTVRQSSPMSHHGKGWEQFTDQVIKVLSERSDPLVFLLWGKSAQQKCEHLVFNRSHLVLKASHPSPYSAQNFFGCRHFSKANQFLVGHGKAPIQWGA